jgi:hypothetical protein
MTTSVTDPFLVDEESSRNMHLSKLWAQFATPSARAANLIEIQVIANGVIAASGTFNGEQVWIGRSPSNDLVVDEPAFSRYHAVVERRGAGFMIRDLQSLNGLRQDGRRVAAWNVNSGDTLTVGEFDVSFTVECVAAVIDPPVPEDLARALGLFGRTISVSPETQEKTVRERSSRLHAWLSSDEGAHAIERDVVTLGGASDSDVRLNGIFVPPWCAVIVRGPGGFSVHNVSPTRDAVHLDGEPLADTGWLSNASVLEVQGRRFVFYVGAVPEGMASANREAADGPPARGPVARDPVAAPARRRGPVRWVRYLGLSLWVGALIAFFVNTFFDIKGTF